MEVASTVWTILCTVTQRSVVVYSEQRERREKKKGMEWIAMVSVASPKSNSIPLVGDGYRAQKT
jgi:hypothetical protein